MRLSGGPGRRNHSSNAQIDSTIHGGVLHELNDAVVRRAEYINPVDGHDLVTGMQ